MKCPKHPRYQALRAPTADCAVCQAKWAASLGGRGAKSAREFLKKTSMDIDEAVAELERIAVESLVADHADHLLKARRVNGVRGLYYDCNRDELRAALSKAYRMGREDAGG